MNYDMKDVIDGLLDKSQLTSIVIKQDLKIKNLNHYIETIQKKVMKIQELISSGEAFLWDPSGGETARCIALENYNLAGMDEEEDILKIESFLPHFGELIVMLNLDYYYRIFDNQTQQYMYTGYNDRGYDTIKKSIISFYTVGKEWEPCERTKLWNMDLEQLEEMWEITIEHSFEPFKDLEE